MKPFHKISSRDNSKLKFARAVREGKERGKVFIEGLRLAEEVLKTDLEVPSVFFSPKFSEQPRGLSLLKTFATKKSEIFEVDDRIFDSLGDTKNAQGLIVIANKPKTGKLKIELEISSNPLLLLIHQINNPANLGAILRTAEAVGVEGVILTKGTTDVFSPKTLRGAMGANLRLPCWSNADFNEVIEWAKNNGIKTVCADIRSNKNYLDIDWKVPRLLIVGSEGHGLTDSERLSTDESLVIPMENEVESLNVAVACGVLLFEAKRQRSLS